VPEVHREGGQVMAERLPHCTATFAGHNPMCDRDGKYCGKTASHPGECQPHGRASAPDPARLGQPSASVGNFLVASRVATGDAADQTPPGWKLEVEAYRTARATSGSEALRRFEQRLIPARTTAGQVEAWEAYRADWLPSDDKVAAEAFTPLINQGFAAGYDAAMARVRAILGSVQSEILRENR
jgi:hypothetical protein